MQDKNHCIRGVAVQWMEMINLYFKLALSVASLLLASAIVTLPSITIVGVLVAAALYAISFAAWAKASGLTTS